MHQAAIGTGRERREMKPSLRIGPQAPGPAPLQRRLINRPARKRVGCVGHPTRPRRLLPNRPDSRVARPAAGSPVDGRPLPGTSRGRCPASTTCARRERIRQPTFAPRAQRKHAVCWQGSPARRRPAGPTLRGRPCGGGVDAHLMCVAEGSKGPAQAQQSRMANCVDCSWMQCGADKPLWALWLALVAGEPRAC